MANGGCARCGGRVGVPFNDIVHKTIICVTCYRIREKEQDYQNKIKEILQEEPNN